MMVPPVNPPKKPSEFVGTEHINKICRIPWLSIELTIRGAGWVSLMHRSVAVGELRVKFITAHKFSFSITNVYAIKIV